MEIIPPLPRIASYMFVDPVGALEKLKHAYTLIDNEDEEFICHCVDLEFYRKRDRPKNEVASWIDYMIHPYNSLPQFLWQTRWGYNKQHKEARLKFIDSMITYIEKQIENKDSV